MIKYIMVFLVSCIILSSCTENSNIIGGSDSPSEIVISENGVEFMYKQISKEEAKSIMDSGEPHIVLDTREQWERIK